MERKRDELVSAGAGFSVLVGKVKKALQPLPQGVHHFTRLDQVNQLVGASEADADMGFMTRLMALCSLPRSNPGNRLQFKRVNGPYMLIITATGKHKLPFGNLPRLLLAWVCTEAVRTQSRELVLGSSLSEFMRELGMQTSGGSARGDRRRLQNQMQRLFSCTVAMIHEDKHGEKFVSSAIAEQGEFWWDPARPDDRTLWESKIELGEKFFTEIIQHPVPLDMNILKALKRSSLGLDIYLWLVYRTFALKKPQRVSWKQPLPPVRSGPGAGWGQYHRSEFPKGLPAGVEEDQDILARAELRHGQGGVDSLPLGALDPAGAKRRLLG